MDKNISKSSATLEREAKVKALRASLKQRKSTLKGLKTRLKHFKEDIRDTQQNTQNVLFNSISKLDSLREEIGELAKKLKKHLQFSKEDKLALDEIAQQFLDENIFGNEFAEIRQAQQKMEEGDFDVGENEQAEMWDMFQAFQVAPDQKEQQDIREVYKKLSRKFHPDLARGKKQEAEYHRIMQQINEAYKAHDIQALLEIESLYLTEEIDLSATFTTSDMLQQEIKRLQRELESINGQIDRVSQEIKQIRQSELGQMLTNVNRAERAGMGIGAMESEFDQMIQQLENIREGFEDTLKRGEVSPILMQMLNPFDVFHRDGTIGGGEDLMELVDIFSMFESDYEVNENPLFPEGSCVKVKTTKKYPLAPRPSMKNWQGWVEGAYIDEAGFPIYSVIFDSVTMKAMPQSLIEEVVSEGGDFQKFTFFEHQLAPATEREDRSDALTSYWTLRVEAQWKMLVEGEKLDLAKSILLADPKESDKSNWETYLASCMPFQAKAKGQFDLAINKSVRVMELFSFYDDVGFTVLIQEKKGKGEPDEHPLRDLIPTDDHLRMVVELYNLWFLEIFEEDPFF